MGLFRKIDERYGNSGIWQFIKFNIVSMSVYLLQMLLANLLPLIFDGVTAKLPVLLRGVFDPQVLFDGDSKYVVDSITKGWVYGWKKRGWINSTQMAIIKAMPIHSSCFPLPSPPKGRSAYPASVRPPLLRILSYPAPSRLMIPLP